MRRAAVLVVLGLAAAPLDPPRAQAAPPADPCLGGLADAWLHVALPASHQPSRSPREALAGAPRHGAPAAIAADALYAAYFRCAEAGGAGGSAAAAAAVRPRRVAQAELRWTLAERDPAWWPGAAASFALVARDPVQPAAVRAEAAYARLLALRNAEALAEPVGAPRDRDGPDDVPGQVPAPRPIPAGDRELLEAIDDYLRLATPGTDEAITVRFLRARLLWRHAHLAEAALGLAAIVDDAPDHEVAEFALNLLLDALNRLGREADLVAWVDRVRREPRFAKLRARVEVLDQLAFQIARKDAEKREAAGDHAGCAAAYESAANAFPKEAAADECLYNATVCWLGAGRVADARRTADTLVKRHGKKSALATRAQQLVADAEKHKAAP